MPNESGLSRRDEYAVLSVIIVTIFLLTPLLHEEDIFFMLANGRHIADTGIIPAEDVLTMHSGMHAIVQQWLAALAFWKIYSVWGFDGIYALVYVSALITLLLFYRLALFAACGNRFVALPLTLVAGFNAVTFFFRTRPLLFSTPLILAAVLCLERYAQSGKKIYLSGLWLLSVLLVNVHAALWPLMIIVMLPYLAAAIHWQGIEKYAVANEKTNVLPLSVCLVGIVIAAFLCNPYGTEALTYGIVSYGAEEIRTFGQEMRPVTVDKFFGKVFFLLCAVFCFLLTRYKNKLSYTLLTLGFMYMTLNTQRNVLFFFLLGTLSPAYMLRNFSPGQYFSRRAVTVCLLSLLLWTASIAVYIPDNRKYAQGLEPAADYILSHSSGHRVTLLTDFLTAPYFEFYGIKPFIDTRDEIFLAVHNKQADYLTEYHDLLRGKLSCADFFARYRFDYCLTYEGDGIYEYLRHDNRYEQVLAYDYRERPQTVYGHHFHLFRFTDKNWRLGAGKDMR